MKTYRLRKLDKTIALQYKIWGFWVCDKLFDHLYEAFEYCSINNIKYVIYPYHKITQTYMGMNEDDIYRIKRKGIFKWDTIYKTNSIKDAQLFCLSHDIYPINKNVNNAEDWIETGTWESINYKLYKK